MKNNHGGKRKGAGRKPSPYYHKTISFFIRQEWEAEIKELVKTKIQELKNRSNFRQQ